MADSIAFFVPGIPAPAGSKRAFPFRKKDGSLGVNVSHDNKRSRPWMSAVAEHAAEAMGDRELITGPVSLTVLYTFPRPKGHYGTGRNSGTIKPLAPEHHVVKPDRGKLDRAIEDALTGVVYRDDAQVYIIRSTKGYVLPLSDLARHPGAWIHVRWQ